MFGMQNVCMLWACAEDVEEVKWIGLETAKRLHQEEEGVIFIDVRDRRDFAAGHIADAFCTPLPEIIEPRHTASEALWTTTLCVAFRTMAS